MKKRILVTSLGVSLLFVAMIFSPTSANAQEVITGEGDHVHASCAGGANVCCASTKNKHV